MDSRIGQLTRNGRPVFYAYTNGYHQEPFEGTLEQVETALGVRLACSVELDLGEASEPAPAPVKAARLAWNVRRYLVTITPRYTIRAGGLELSEYTVEIDARSSNAAIKQAREDHNDIHWNNAARYRARLLRDA